MFSSVGHAQLFRTCPTPRTSVISVSSVNIKDTIGLKVTDIFSPTPFFEEPYGYTSIDAFRTSSRVGTVYANLETLQIENVCGALRSTFRPRPTNVCQKYYSGYDLNFPQPVGQAFVEVWARFDTSFVVQLPRSDSTSCRTQSGSSSLDGGKYYYERSGFVFLMGRVNSNAGAFGVTVGTGYPFLYHQADVGTPCFFDWPDAAKQTDEDNRHVCGYTILRLRYGYEVYGTGKEMEGREVFAKKLMQFDGKWHRYRFWFKAANGTYPNGASVSIWVDEDHLGTLLTQDTAADKLIGLSIGRFIWHQPTKPQYVEYGRVRVWSSNPGWNTCQSFCR